MPYKATITISLFLFSLIGLSFVGRGQILSNEFGVALSNHPYFNADFIRRNKIESIKGHFNYYQLGSAPIKTDDFIRFVFNRKGQLVKKQQYQGFLNKKDTVNFIYAYDTLGRLQLLGKYTSYGAYAYRYFYNSDNRLVQKIFYQKMNTKFDATHPFFVKDLSLIYTEKISYIRYDSQIKGVVHNSAGKPYKYLFTYYDSLHRIIGVREKNIRTLNVKNKSYSYNDYGNIDTVYISSNSEHNPDKKIVFGYDENHNLLYKKEYAHGVYLNQTQVIYDKRGLFITDILQKNERNNFMKIFRVDNYNRY